VCKAGEVATAKAERLLNLVIALLNSPRFRTAAWIRDKVAGYADAPTEEAFFRTFERDKTELRDLGIPLQTPADLSDGYRILPGEFSLPQLSFTPAETAALGLAARLWETTALAEAGSNAIRKIRDAAKDDAQTEQTAYATSLLQPRVRTSDPSFAPLYAAVRSGRAVTFDYRKNLMGVGETRSVQPWGLVSYKGRWYVVGHDTDRAARRTFRLSRIIGSIRTVGRSGAVSAPAGLDLLQLVAGSVELPAGRSATLVIRPGTGAGLRRVAARALNSNAANNSAELSWEDSPEAADALAAHPDWEVVLMPFAHLWDTARILAEQGPDVVVTGPPDLRDAVIRLLRGARVAAVAGQQWDPR